MAQRTLWAVLGCLFLFSCTTLRKISQVETRAPASGQNGNVISALRASFSNQESIQKSCPKEIREATSLSEERVKFSACPEHLSARLEAAREALSVTERSSVEELMAGQCRNLFRDLTSDALNNLIQALDPATANPGIRNGGPAEFSDADLKKRQDLRDSLTEVRQENGPLENWVRNNGEFVISEDALQFFAKIVSRPDCRMKPEEVDASYRAVRGLEDLARLESESEPQRARIERFLSGVHQVMDRNIREFFPR